MNDPTAARGHLHARFDLETSDGETLACDARFPTAGDGPFPVVVFVHGFKGFKDWGPFPTVCARIAEAGYHVVSFNFSHNGVGDDSQEFTQLDRFASNTFSREVRELLEVIEAARDGSIGSHGAADASRIAVIGHSRGGGIALIAASRDGRLDAVVTWSAVATFDRYTERQKRLWRHDGYLEARNARTGQLMRLDVGLLDDLEENAEALDVVAAARSLRTPLLVVHGEQDLTVSIDDAERIVSASGAPVTELVRVPHTGHTFGTVHPFESSTAALDLVVERTTDFLSRTVGSAGD